jgi:RES domain-containing protein
VVLATFVTSRALSVLDLCGLPDVPSQFDLSKQHQIDQIAFLHEFVTEISQPVSKHDDERIAYVPTQVVSEWFSQVFTPQGKDSRLDGLIYPSAVRPGGKNLVLFPRGDRWERKIDSVDYVGAKELNLSNWIELQNVIA